MKKMLLSLLFIVLLFLVYRMLFAYTIVSIPIVGDAYESGSKEQFDISILNPFYKKKLQDKYQSYINDIPIQTEAWRNAYFEKIKKSGFQIKNLRRDGNELYVLVHSIDKNGNLTDGYFIYDISLKKIVESEP